VSRMCKAELEYLDDLEHRIAAEESGLKNWK
jgi:hypothetical protein